MTKKDLPTFRQLVKNQQIDMTKHAVQQCLSRGYSVDDVVTILSSSSNQLVEVQPPCSTPGKAHRDERYVIADPEYSPETAVVTCLDLFDPANPRVVVVTVEPALDKVWKKNKDADPWLIRIGTSG